MAWARGRNITYRLDPGNWTETDAKRRWLGRVGGSPMKIGLPALSGGPFVFGG